MAYTNIDDPSAYFQAMQYTGNTTAPRNITNDGNSDLKPDFIWAKANQNGTNHILTDSTKGFDAPTGLGYTPPGTLAGGHLSTSSDGAVSQPAATYGYISAHLTDGFTTAAGGTNDDTCNTNGTVHNAWQWKANGGTTSNNTDGNLASTVQANQTSGFSIVLFEGSGSDNTTVGHGLGGVPDFVMFKNAEVANTDWRVYHKGMAPGNAMSVNSNGAQYDSTAIFTSTFTSTVLKLENDAGGVNRSGSVMMAYCWRSIQGFSKFGTYQGNSNDNGPFVYTGFKPRWIMFKSREAGSTWDIMDTRNSPTNPMDDYFTANTTDPRGTSSTKNIDFLSNGFKLRDDNNLNFSSHNFTYMAFAESPFVTSTGTPTTAR